MNLIILVDKQKPHFTPLVFICPDTCHKEFLESALPQSIRDKYHITQCDGDMPTVVGDEAGIITMLKDDPAWPKNDPSSPSKSTRKR